MITSPLLGLSMPDMRLSSVDLPLPDWPDDRHELARVNVEIHIVESGEISGGRRVSFAYGAHGDERVGLIHDIGHDGGEGVVCMACTGSYVSRRPRRRHSTGSSCALSEMPLLSTATSSRLSSPDIAEWCPAFNLGEET